jgi:hypothetical protein
VLDNATQFLRLCCACVLTLLHRNPCPAEQVHRRFPQLRLLSCEPLATLFRWCSTLPYRCPNAGVCVTDPTLGLWPFCTVIPTALYNFLDFALHRKLTFSISSQFSMHRCKDAYPQVNRESCRDAPKKGFNFPNNAAQVITQCRVGGPRPRSSLLGRLADMLALISSCLRGTVSEIVRESNRVYI